MASGYAQWAPSLHEGPIPSKIPTRGFSRYPARVSRVYTGYCTVQLRLWGCLQENRASDLRCADGSCRAPCSESWYSAQFARLVTCTCIPVDLAPTTTWLLCDRDSKRRGVPAGPDKTSRGQVWRRRQPDGEAAIRRLHDCRSRAAHAPAGKRPHVCMDRDAAPMSSRAPRREQPSC